MRHILIFFLTLVGISCVARAQLASPTMLSAAQSIALDPYVGAIAVEAKSGIVLFDDSADAAIFPASTVKLMDLLLILDKVRYGDLNLSDTVAVDEEAAGIGGSQVYLRCGEHFTIDDLLYALMLPSANDAAVALAIHVAGSKQAFVQLMNERATAIGMTSTSFASVHGLPPAKGDRPDVSTPRDLSLLACEVLKYPESLRYTACRERALRPGKQPFVMYNHNHLLNMVEGCDGLKTGFFNAAGFSVVATAEQYGRRIVAVVAGCQNPRTRDKTAQRLLTELSWPERGRGNSTVR